MEVEVNLSQSNGWWWWQPGPRPSPSDHGNQQVRQERKGCSFKIDRHILCRKYILSRSRRWKDLELSRLVGNPWNSVKWRDVIKNCIHFYVTKLNFLQSTFEFISLEPLLIWCFPWEPLYFSAVSLMLRKKRKLADVAFSSSVLHS